MNLSLRLKGLAAAVLMAGTPMLADAQAPNLIDGARFQVLTPASIQGMKQITTGYSSTNPTTSWGGSFDPPLINKPVIRALGTGNGGTDSLLCTPPASNKAFTGQVALIFRGDCNFSAKAFEAQQAGAIAVVIVNNIPGPPVGMASGTNGAQVTIPVVMVSDVVGKAMNSAIRNGNAVNISLSNWSFGQPNDYAIITRSGAPFHASAIPAKQLSGSAANAPYRIYTGAIVANFGTDTMRNTVIRNNVTWNPAGGTSQQIYTDTIVLGSFAPIDSIAVSTSPRFFNPEASINGKGFLEIRHSLSADMQDGDTSDNSFISRTAITDSIYAKGQYNFDSMRPFVSRHVRPAGNPSPPIFAWGALFYTAKGGDYFSKIQYSVSSDAPDSLDNKTVLLPVFKFTDGADGNPIDGVFQPGELSLKALGQSTFSAGTPTTSAATAIYKPVASQTPASLKLEDNSYYWYAVNVLEETTFLGHGAEVNPYTRLLASARISPSNPEFYAPIYLNDYTTINAGASPADFRMIPFGANAPSIDVETASGNLSSGALAVAVHVTATPPSLSVSSLPSAVKSFEVFPNPAVNTDLNLKWTVSPSGKKVIIAVYNAIGQPVITRQTTDLIGSAVLPMSEQPAGNYWVVLVTEDGVDSRQISVVR